MKLQDNKIYILAGAIGTEIQRRGFRTELPLWSAKVLFEDPELLKDIYLDYIRAGADIITTNTFRTQRRTFAKVGLTGETERINALAGEIAAQARNEANADRNIYIAGCITTLEDCYRPDLVPSNQELEKEHLEQAKFLARTPIDFFLLETFNSVKEAKIAAKAVRKTGKDFMVSFVLDKSANILSGESLEDAVEVISSLQPLAYLVNCVQPDIATQALRKLKQATNLPIGEYGNGDGEPSEDLGWKFHSHDKIKSYTAHCRDWVNLGATIIGGCCGTNPDYTKSYARIKKQINI